MATSSKLTQNLFHRCRLTRVRLRDRLGDRGVQRVPFISVEVVSFVVYDEIQHGALRQLGWLIDDEAPVSNRRAKTHEFQLSGTRRKAARLSSVGTAGELQLASIGGESSRGS